MSGLNKCILKVRAKKTPHMGRETGITVLELHAYVPPEERCINGVWKVVYPTNRKTQLGRIELTNPDPKAVENWLGPLLTFHNVSEIIPV